MRSHSFRQRGEQREAGGRAGGVLDESSATVLRLRVRRGGLREAEQEIRERETRRNIRGSVDGKKLARVEARIARTEHRGGDHAIPSVALNQGMCSVSRRG